MNKISRKKKKCESLNSVSYDKLDQSTQIVQFLTRDLAINLKANTKIFLSRCGATNTVKSIFKRVREISREKWPWAPKVNRLNAICLRFLIHSPKGKREKAKVKRILISWALAQTDVVKSTWLYCRPKQQQSHEVVTCFLSYYFVKLLLIQERFR